MELDPVEARVIGSLAEKQLTTPQQYPLTFNALVLACNQSSNRDPVVAYDESTVELALSALKEAGLLRFVHPGHGRSATRYRQVLDERFALDSRSLSVLTVLMLRGPQTVGELRARTERMADFGDLDQLEAELERLGAGPDPLVRRLARRPGQKEERWAQLLTGETPEPDDTSDSPTPVTDAAVRARSVQLNDEVASLRDDVNALQEEVAEIKAVVEKLRAAFDL
ncbi:MAG TPA: YceH family protein [Acidimicrobiales bacterium]